MCMELWGMVVEKENVEVGVEPETSALTLCARRFPFSGNIDASANRPDFKLQL